MPPEEHTRERSIFYFQRAELMRDNEALWGQIQRMTERVERLKSIVDDHKTLADRKKEREEEDRLSGMDKRKRSHFRYHPPGLSVRKTNGRL
jgi:hypothetical protein